MFDKLSKSRISYVKANALVSKSVMLKDKKYVVEEHDIKESP